MEVAVISPFPHSSFMGKLIQGEAPTIHLLRCFSYVRCQSHKDHPQSCLVAGNGSQRKRPSQGALIVKGMAGWGLGLEA